MPGVNGVRRATKACVCRGDGRGDDLIASNVCVGSGFDLGGTERARLDAGTRVSGSWSETAGGQGSIRCDGSPPKGAGLDWIGLEGVWGRLQGDQLSSGRAESASRRRWAWPLIRLSPERDGEIEMKRGREAEVESVSGGLDAGSTLRSDQRS